MWRNCNKLPDGWTPAQGQEGRGAGGGRGRGRGVRGDHGGGAANMKSGDNDNDSSDDQFPGQFFFVSMQSSAGQEKVEGFEEPAAVGKETLHSLDYWVIDNGATYSMTPRADMLTELEPSPIKHISVVPMAKERQVAASVSTKGEAAGRGDDANDGIKENESKKCNLGGTSKQCEHKESGEAAKEQQKGENNSEEVAEEEYGESMWGTIASAAFSNPTSATGECDWLTLYQRMGHVALPILQQLVKEEMVAGIRVKGEPNEVLGCPTCMQAKFSRFLLSSSEATAKRPLDEVHLRHNKLGAKAIWAVHLGMAQNSKGWILWDPFTKKFLVSRDCKFMENLMYKDWKAENEAKIGVRFGEVKSSAFEHVELPLELSSNSTITRQSPLVNGGEEARNGEEEGEEVQQTSKRAPTLPSRATSSPRIRVTPQQRHESLHVPAAEEEGMGKMRIQAPNRLTYDMLGKPAKSALAGAAMMVGDDEESEYEEFAFAFFSPVEMSGEPATLKEALKITNAKEWKKAMESELNIIEENGTWELVELPDGRKAITTK
ncbi:unnamed protein product [Closterium sp. NIES-53]